MTDLANLPVVITVAPEYVWVDAEQAARLLGYDARVFAEKIAVRPGFPEALRIDGKGHPRWNAGELNAWAKAERAKSAGRPRRGFRKRAA